MSIVTVARASDLARLGPPAALGAAAIFTGALLADAHAQTVEPTELDEIVVEGAGVTSTSAGPVDGYRALTADTATQTRTPLEEIPQSIVVIPRTVIDDQATETIGDALRNVAGVQPNNPASTPAFDQTFVRGFQAEFLDDGFTRYQYNPGDRESLANIERIEVLKGPSALLYSGGSGAPVGGVINLVSKKPEAEAFGQFDIRAGSHQFVQPTFDVNQPLSDQLRVRVTGEYTSSDSHIEVLDTDRFNINPSLLLTDNDRTSLLVQGRYSSWRQQEYQGLPATGTIAGGAFISSDLFIGPSDIERSFSTIGSLDATLSHEMSDAVAFKLRLRYSTAEFEENVQTISGADGFVADQPFAEPSTWGLVNAELFQEQEELSGSATTTVELDPFGAPTTLLFGVDGSRLDDEGFIDAAFLADSADLADPEFSTPYTDPGPEETQSTVENRTAGAFAQAQTTIADRLHLLGGVRLGYVSVDTNGQEGQETRLLPRIGAVFDITDSVGVFASYAEGLRGQPFANFVERADPVETRSVEAGLKFNVFDQLSGTIAVFQIDRKNIAVTDFTDPLFRSIAEGEERSRGVELDAIWSPTPAIDVIASYAYTDAVFTNDTSAGADGDRLPGVPEHSGRLWANYTFQQPELEGLRAGVGVYAQSGEAVSADNVFETDGFYTVDAALNYDTETFGATLAIRNLTDENYFDRYGYFGGRVAPADGVNGFVGFRIRY